jgi:hypothetical protein
MGCSGEAECLGGSGSGLEGDLVAEGQEGLQSLRFKLASALFSGMPPGAKQVLEPQRRDGGCRRARRSLC